MKLWTFNKIKTRKLLPVDGGPLQETEAVERWDMETKSRVWERFISEMLQEEALGSGKGGEQEVKGRTIQRGQTPKWYVCHLWRSFHPCSYIFRCRTLVLVQTLSRWSIKKHLESWKAVKAFPSEKAKKTIPRQKLDVNCTMWEVKGQTDQIKSRIVGKKILNSSDQHLISFVVFSVMIRIQT